MILIGLTGGIACGKSTVAALLQDDPIRIEVIDCDAIVRELQGPNTAAVRAIAALWPDCVNSATGELDRAALGRVVFSDSAARRKLASIMNWRIFLTVLQKILSAWWRHKRGDVVVLDAPILYESKLFVHFISSSLVVACRADVQKRRLMYRNTELSSVDADQRIASQMPLDEKIRRAGHVIHNDSDVYTLKGKVDDSVAWMRKQTPIWYPSVALALCCCCCFSAIVAVSAWW